MRENEEGRTEGGGNRRSGTERETERENGRGEIGEITGEREREARARKKREPERKKNQRKIIPLEGNQHKKKTTQGKLGESEKRILADFFVKKEEDKLYDKKPPPKIPTMGSEEMYCRHSSHHRRRLLYVPDPHRHC